MINVPANTVAIHTGAAPQLLVSALDQVLR